MKKTLDIFFQCRLHKLIGVVIAATLFIGLAGCEKEEDNEKCFECEMTYSSGASAGTQYPCTSNITQWQNEQKDNNGQPISSACKIK